MDIFQSTEISEVIVQNVVLLVCDGIKGSYGYLLGMNISDLADRASDVGKNNSPLYQYMGKVKDFHKLKDKDWGYALTK